MRPLLSRTQNFLQTRSPVFIFLLGFIFILLLGAIDYFTGGGRAFDFAYLLPVFLVSWYVGLRAGIFTASLTVLTVVITSGIGHLPINWSEVISTAILMLVMYILFVILVFNLRSNSRKLAGTLSVLNATLDSTLDGILVVDQAGKIVNCNHRFTDMWKLPPALMADGDDDKTLAYILDQLIDPDAFMLKVKELGTQVEARSFDVLEFKDGRTFERFSQPQRVDDRIVGQGVEFPGYDPPTPGGEGVKDSEFELPRSFAAMPDTILIMDQDGRFLKIAPADPGHVRQPAEKMVGKTLHEIYPKEQADEFLRKIHSAIQTGQTGHFEYTLPFMEQNTWYSASVSPMKGNTILWVARDISERKQAEALQDAVYRIATATETTRSLEDLFPQIHQIISSVMPADNFYITLYDELHQTLRFPFNTDAVDTPYLGEIQTGKGKTSYVLRTGKSLLCTKEVHEELVKRGDVIFLGVPSAIWLGVPLITEGKTIGAMVVQHYTDPNAYTVREQHMLEFVSTQVAIAITRKQAEKALENSEAELKALFAAMTDVVIVYDRDGNYREIVPTDPNIQAMHPNLLIGKSLYDVFPKDDADRHVQNIRTVLETGTKMETEYILRVAGRSVWFACTISPIQADAVIWVAHDITNRIQAEKVQEAIYAISDAAISTESIEELYHSIHTSLAELIHVENFFIALYDPMKNMISFPYFVDQYDPAPQETRASPWFDRICHAHRTTAPGTQPGLR